MNLPDEKLTECAEDPLDLCNEHIGLARSIAEKYFNIPGIEPDDVIQEAMKGLIKAACAFDPAKGKFASYAGTAIRNGLNDVYGKQNRIRNAETDTLDQPDCESGLTLEEITADTKVSRTLPMEHDETKRILDEEIAKLSGRPHAIVRGFMAGKSGEEIAQELGISRQSVNASLKGTLAALKKRLLARGLRGQESCVLYAGVTDPRDGGARGLRDRKAV